MYYIIYMHMNKSRTVFDKNIFDTIDTEEKAYWLGFIYADGNISSHKEGVKNVIVLNYHYQIMILIILKNLKNL